MNSRRNLNMSLVGISGRIPAGITEWSHAKIFVGIPTEILEDISVEIS